MFDKYQRCIDYLRISVTDRCNFQCTYCMPPPKKERLDLHQILSYEELLRIITVLGRYGVSKIRLTGGEPLVRRGLVDFIRNIRQIKTVKELSMTTNGSLLGRDNMAARLKAAGLDRVNISMDTADAAKFAAITGTGCIDDVLAGINSALTAGLHPVKLNVVVTEQLTAGDIAYFVNQVRNRPVTVRFIEYMPIGQTTTRAGMSIDRLKQVIEKASGKRLQPAVAVHGSGPARYYRLPETQGVFGFITPMSNHFCHKCNRLRLTTDGKIKACLLSNQEVDLKSAMRHGCDDQTIYDLFVQAIQDKLPQHTLNYHSEHVVVTRPMFRVGG